MLSSTSSLIIPAYYANDELVEMTNRCIASAIGPDEVILVVDERKEGYAVTTNKGLRQAKGDILIVGNNDLIFPEGWLEELLRPLSEYDIVTCWTSDQEKVKLEKKMEENPKFGSLFAMRREVYGYLGGFDEQFKGYFSDTDYRRRAINEGFRIGKNLNLVVEHLAKATYSLTDPNDEEFLRSCRLYEIKWGFVE